MSVSPSPIPLVQNPNPRNYIYRCLLAKQKDQSVQRIKVECCRKLIFSLFLFFNGTREKGSIVREKKNWVTKSLPFLKLKTLTNTFKNTHKSYWFHTQWRYSCVLAPHGLWVYLCNTISSIVIDYGHRFSVHILCIDLCVELAPYPTKTIWVIH